MSCRLISGPDIDEPPPCYTTEIFVITVDLRSYSDSRNHAARPCEGLLSEEFGPVEHTAQAPPVQDY